MFIFRFSVTVFVAALFTFTLSVQARRSPRTRANSDSLTPCRTNGECLSRGLPILPVEKRFTVDRRLTDFTPVVSQGCGFNRSVYLPPGTYSVTLQAGKGGDAKKAGFVGGVGASVFAEIVVASPVSVSYYVGCQGTYFSEGSGGSGGGGGGTFLYIDGPEQPAILVAGGGGGAAYPTGQGASIADGQPGGMTFDGRGTTGDGSTGSVMGQGGARGSNADDYTAGGGGGFISPGLPRTTQISSGQGGSNSYNYGGDFSGGQTSAIPRQNQQVVERTGGAGGGGGAGYLSGGGGGGYSGGDGGTLAQGTGGGGGGTFASTVPVRGVTVAQRQFIPSTEDADGFLTIQQP